MSVQAPPSDPTRSVTRRRDFVREFTRRWRALRGEIRDAIDRNDRFNLSSDNAVGITPGVAESVERFRRWLEGKIDDVLVEPVSVPEVRDGMHWSAGFIRDAWEHGISRADTALRQSEYEVPAIAAAAALFRDRHKEELRKEYVRTYQAIVNAGRAVEQDVVEEFDETRQMDVSRRETADSLNDRVEAVGPNTHTTALAHGAIVVAINRASIVRYRQAGVERVGASVEGISVDTDVSGPVTDDPRAAAAGAPGDPSKSVTWHTAGDRRVCPECKALAGKTWGLDSDDLMIPVKDTHLRCRCYLVPAAK